ncbi:MULTISPECIES: hypothetical protein [Pseudomonas]|uniref:Uncharacterized protein n=1 Tax=Pseudomonas eucalypticola TaxID=2599595 RepID=A0A7D5HFI3_9PSED|nr:MULTISPECIES: hypothetical protein [Pseudomonas]QKZ04026.1 hypothetical protein HWQ56_09620 [Pseudomonas eucalypticola]
MVERIGLGVDLVTGCKPGRRMTLTIGKTVLQTIEPTLGNKGPRSQPNFLIGPMPDEVDDTPEMESFAEGYEHGKR